MANKKIVGIFQTQEEAIRAIERLKRVGYEDNEISVIAEHREDLDIIKDRTDAKTTSQDVTDGAVGGAVTGGILGGIGALLLEFGVVAIPGIGPFLAAGPIAATLAGIAAGGAAGGIVGALVDLGLTKAEADEYKQYLDKGYILVLVDQHADRDVYSNFYENNSLNRDHYDYNPNKII